MHYFVRMTNLRIVLSAVEYPILPRIITMFLDEYAKPKRITYAWEWDKVIRIEHRSRKNLLHMTIYFTVIETLDNSLKFKKNQQIVDFWENRKGNL